MRRFCLPLTLIVCFYTLRGQDNPVYLGLGVQKGFIIPHSEELRPVSDTYPVGFSLDYSTLKVSDEAWSTCYCFGRTGFSFTYFNYLDPDQLGSSYNLLYFVQPYFDINGPFTFSLRAGGGLTYVTRVYDQEENPSNLFFSTPLSFYLVLSPTIAYALSRKWEVNMAFNYSHISNGGSKQPNKGMNFPNLSVGINRRINYFEPEPKSDSLRDRRRKWQIYSGLFGSLRSADESAEGSNYLLIGTNIGLMRSLSVINGLNLGVEVSYDDSYRRRLEKSGEAGDAWVSSILVGHQFTIGDVYFYQQLGYYIDGPRQLLPGDFFQRYALYYNFWKNVGLGFSLIAYGQVADHMDLRIIYLW